MLAATEPLLICFVCLGVEPDRDKPPEKRFLMCGGFETKIFSFEPRIKPREIFPYFRTFDADKA